MSKAKLVMVLAAVVTVVVVTGLVIVPYFSNNLGADLSVRFKDADGNYIGLPLSWQRGGATIVDIESTITWTATGTDMNWDTLDLTGYISIHVDTPQQEVLIASKSFTSFEQTGSETLVLLMSELESGTIGQIAMEAGTITLYVRATLDGDAKNIAGTTIDRSWTANMITIVLSYVEDGETTTPGTWTLDVMFP